MAKGRKVQGGRILLQGTVFDTVPLISFQPLPRAPPPQLRCHQPPVTERGLSIFMLHSFIMEMAAVKALFLQMPPALCQEAEAVQP